MKLNISKIEITNKERKKPKYIPLSKKQDRPEAALWLTKNHPNLSDSQIAKLVGTTKKTVVSIRKKNYWNFNNLSAKDPVAINLCSQLNLFKAIEKSNKKVEREKKINEEQK